MAYWPREFSHHLSSTLTAFLSAVLPFSRRGCVQRADHVRLVPEGRREALLPEHGQRAEELLQREVLRRLPQSLF